MWSLEIMSVMVTTEGRTKSGYLHFAFVVSKGCQQFDPDEGKFTHKCKRYHAHVKHGLDDSSAINARVKVREVA